MSWSRLLVFAGKKAAGSLITIFLIMTIVFILMNSVPGGDPVLRRYGLASKEVQDQIREAWGLTRPLYERYILYMKNVFTFNYTLYEDQEYTAVDLLLPLLPYTLLLFGTSTILTYVLGTVVGIRVLARKNKSVENVIAGISIALYALPVFVLAIIFKTWLVFRYEVLPPVSIAVSFMDGHVRSLGDMDFIGNMGTLLPSMVLPLAILVMVGLARPLLLIREQMATLADEPFVTTARAKGLSENDVYSKHIARCALLPLLNDAAVNLALIVSGGIIIEYVFSWPGIGLALFEALKYLDSPVVSCSIFLLTLTLLSLLLVADVVCAYLDPRVS
ncbi:MAG: ABC transporter permease [Theionarchaea archaeon]|nr:ABC transporter permease [Theionarchaea archaeon]